MTASYSSRAPRSVRWQAEALLGLWLACLGCSKPPAAAPSAAPSSSWPAELQRSDAAQREQVALTVYRDFALVRERRRLRLGSGRVALAYEDVSAHLQPASVHLEPLGDPAQLLVLEQNYRYDLLTPEKLLERYVGRQVSLLRYDRAAGADVARSAEVLATAGGPNTGSSPRIRRSACTWTF